MPLNRKTSMIVKNLNSLNKSQLKFVIDLLDQETIASTKKPNQEKKKNVSHPLAQIVTV